MWAVDLQIALKPTILSFCSHHITLSFHCITSVQTGRSLLRMAAMFGWPPWRRTWKLRTDSRWISPYRAASARPYWTRWTPPSGCRFWPPIRSVRLSWIPAVMGHRRRLCSGRRWRNCHAVESLFAIPEYGQTEINRKKTTYGGTSNPCIIGQSRRRIFIFYMGYSV